MDNVFPSQIILPEEADNKRHELRLIVQKVQAAYLSLRDDVDFTLPDFEQLTADYGREYYRPFVEAIAHDITIDDATRERLRQKWTRIQAATVGKINQINNLISSTPQLQWKFNDTIKLPTPTASIDKVADMMATKKLDPKAAAHWALLQKVVEAYKDLRQFEESNKVGKKPLQWLFKLTMTAFAEQWASGCFERPEAPDEATAERWRIINQSIF